MNCPIYVVTVIYYHGQTSIADFFHHSIWLDRKDAEQICYNTPQYDRQCVCSYVEVLP